MAAGLITRTVLFTDTVGSTPMRSRIGDALADEIRREHDALLVDAVAAHSGMVVKGTGDGVMAVFEAAASAAACAVAMQQAIDRYRRKREVPLEIRIGLSAGDVSFDNDDYFGTPVNEASRLESAARPGQILAADVVRVLAGTRADVTFVPRGSYELKGFSTPVDVCELLWSPLSARHPVPLPLPLATSTPKFVGRAPEWKRLDDAWKHAAAGAQPVVVLVGESGIGKTRLAARFASEQHEAGALVLFGRCDDGLNVPYQPFVEALRHFEQHCAPPRLRNRLGAHPQELVRLVPELRDIAGSPTAPLSADDDTHQYRLFEAIASWLADAAAADGAVLVLDDLQWAARPTLLMLRHLLRASAPGLIVVATMRAEADAEIQHFISGLGASAPVERIDLAGLDEADVIELLVDSAADDADVTSAARRITEASNGNSFFVTQIVADFAESATALDVLTERVPTRIRDTVMRRLQVLPGPAREVLTKAAIIGPEFDVRVLDAWDAGDSDPLTAIEDAARASMVEEAELGRFRFVHALVPTAILEDLDATRRARLHGEAGAAIERAFPDQRDVRAADLAHHYSIAAGAGPHYAAVAAQFSIAAGDRAREQYAFDDAVAHYENALNLAPAGRSALEHCDVLIALGEAQMRAGDTRARSTLLAAASVADDEGDGPRRLARAALANNPGYWNQLAGVDEEHVAAIERALDRCADDDIATRARLLSLLATETMWVRPNKECRALVEEALTLARSLDDDATTAQVLFRREMVLKRPSDHDERHTIALELHAIAERTKDPLVAVHASEPAYAVALVDGDTVEAERCIAEERRLIEELQQPYLRWAWRTSHGPTDALRHGRFDEAERIADEGLEIGLTIRAPIEAYGYWGATISMVRFEQGRLAELINVMEAAAQVHTSPIQVRQMLAIGWLEAGDLERARDVVDGFSIEELGPTLDIGINHLTIGARLAHIANGLDDRMWAQYAYTLLEPYTGRIATESVVYFGAVDRYLGLAWSTIGDLPTAIAHLENGIEVNRHAGTPTWEARTRLDQARVLVRRGEGDDIVRATTLAREARATAEAFGMATVERDAATLLEQY